MSASSTRRQWTTPVRTRGEVAQLMGLSEHDIKRIEREALRKLRRELQKRGRQDETTQGALSC